MAFSYHGRPPDYHSSHTYIFENVAVSDHARAVFGDVYLSCPDFMAHLTEEQQRRTLLNALHFRGMNSRFSHVLSAEADTCDYVWSTEFPQWLSATTADPVFWINGWPGSGKSTLMKYLVSHTKTADCLRTSQNGIWVIVHFFFDFRAQDSLANTYEGLCRSLLHQVLNHLNVTQQELTRYGLPNDLAHSVQMPQDIMLAIRKIIDGRQVRLLLFADALDEAHTSHTLLIRSILNLGKELNLRACLASRPDPVLSALLSKFPSVSIQHHNRPGIEAYLRHSAENLRAMVSNAYSISDVLISEIESRANGVFLWVYFVFEKLVEGLLHGLQEQEAWEDAQDLPKGLDAMYGRILEQIPKACRQEAAFVLLLVLHAPKPCTLGMLYRFWRFCLVPQANAKKAVEKLSLKQFELRLKGSLGNLIDFVPRTSDYWLVFEHWDQTATVHLLHETLRSFLLQSSMVSSWLPKAMQTCFASEPWMALSTQILHLAYRNTDYIHIFSQVYERRHDTTDYSEQISTVVGSINASIGLVRDSNSGALLVSINDEDRCVHQTFGHACLDAVTIVLSFSDRFLRDHKPLNQQYANELSVATRLPLVDIANFTDRSREISEYFEHWTHEQDMLVNQTLQMWSSRQAMFERRDLAFAASRGDLWYLEYFEAELLNLSQDEKDYLLGCFLSQRVIYSSSSGQSLPTVDKHFQAGMFLLMGRNEISSLRVALYLHNLNKFASSDSITSALCDHGICARALQDPVVYSFYLQPWLGTDKPSDLFDIWLSTDPESENGQGLKLLERIGFNVGNFRDHQGKSVLEKLLQGDAVAMLLKGMPTTVIWVFDWLSQCDRFFSKLHALMDAQQLVWMIQVPLSSLKRPGRNSDLTLPEQKLQIKKGFRELRQCVDDVRKRVVEVEEKA